MDGHKASLAANTTAENLFAQVDEEGYCFVFVDPIVDHQVDVHQLGQDKAFTRSHKRGHKHCWETTTKGWEIHVQWKDGSTSWKDLKDIRESYPVQMAEYAVQLGSLWVEKESVHHSHS